MKQLNPETTFLEDFKSALAQGSFGARSFRKLPSQISSCQGFHMEATGSLRVCDFPWTNCGTFRGPPSLRYWEVTWFVLRIRCQPDFFLATGESLSTSRIKAIAVTDPGAFQVSHQQKSAKLYVRRTPWRASAQRRACLRSKVARARRGLSTRDRMWATETKGKQHV